jgi:hypothetical protein
MSVCFTKWSYVIILIYSWQQCFSCYNLLSWNVENELINKVLDRYILGPNDQQGLMYKKIFICNILLFMQSQNACPRQAFQAKSNKHSSLVWKLVN